jgi:hypothetical protein
MLPVYRLPEGTLVTRMTKQWDNQSKPEETAKRRDEAPLQALSPPPRPHQLPGKAKGRTVKHRLKASKT